MRSLEELVDTQEPGWPVVEAWIASARNRVDVLPVDPIRASEVLTRLQVTTRAPLGAIAYATGGIVIDGWLRALGGSGPRMRGDLASFNGLGEEPAHVEGALVVALDVLGGVFALFGGTRHVGYFAPESLRWQDLGLGYSDFVQTMMNADLDAFFGGSRWSSWRNDVAALTLDEGMQVMPPLWTLESKRLPPSRKPAPMRELVGLAFDVARQLG